MRMSTDVAWGGVGISSEGERGWGREGFGGVSRSEEGGGGGCGAVVWWWKSNKRDPIANFVCHICGFLLLWSFPKGFNCFSKSQKTLKMSWGMCFGGEQKPAKHPRQHTEGF